MKPIKMFSRREARHWIRLACRTASRLERRDLNFSNNQRDCASAHVWNFVSKHCWSSRFPSCCTNGNSLELRSTKIFKRHLFYFIVLVYSYLASWHRWKLVLSSRNYYVVFSCQSMQQIHIGTVVLDLIWFHWALFLLIAVRFPPLLSRKSLRQQLGIICHWILSFFREGDALSAEFKNEKAFGWRMKINIFWLMSFSPTPSLACLLFSS